MKSVSSVMMLLLGATAVLILATGCNLATMEVGPTRTETESVELGGAETVNAEIVMGVGRLDISGGASNLMDATFTYNVDQWKPEVSYDVSGSIGELTVRQPEANIGETGIPESNVEYEWELELNEDVPMDLDISLGVGESQLNLNGLNLTQLNIKTGVGEATIDLSGGWESSFDAVIEGGVGEATLRLPSSVGVRVRPETGLGNLTVNNMMRNGDVYTNAAYGEAPVTLDIDIRGGVGALIIEVVE